MLNRLLVKNQGLSKKDVLELQDLHGVRARLFDAMGELDPEKDRDSLRLYADLLQSLEFDMQRVWKFDQDPEFHSWWYRVPHCKCPKMDNADPIFFNRIISMDCPIHGRTD